MTLVNFEHAEPLRFALQLAGFARNVCPPNPAVGCVLIDELGAVIGQGHTQPVGGPHAEIMALRDAQANRHATVGATAYVTLEPCSHQGRTGPCCDALIAAGIKRVIATHTDPNPLVSGQGFARLRAAGVLVDVLLPGDPMAVQARELNIGFFSRMVLKRPWIRAKMASSLDGKTALANGASQWITSPAARADGHLWRARSCAVLTGIGTILADNPRLDVREVATSRQPHLVIVDAALQTPTDAALFGARRQVLIYTAMPDPTARQALQARGATVIDLPSPTEPGRVDLAAMMQDLARREMNEIHIEAGRGLLGALLQAGLVDDMLLYIAPKLLGPGMDLVHLPPLSSLDEAVSLDYQSLERVGADLRIVARLKDHDRF